MIPRNRSTRSMSPRLHRHPLSLSLSFSLSLSLSRSLSLSLSRALSLSPALSISRIRGNGYWNKACRTQPWSFKCRLRRAAAS